MPFKVIQGHRGRYQSKARMRQPISGFGVIAAYCSNVGHFAFFDHLCGLKDNLRCSSWAHLKARIVDFIELFFARCYG